MPEEKLTLEQLGQKIKAKYPEYKDIPDTELAIKIISKFPEYKDMVISEDELKVKKKEQVTGLPSTDGSLGSEKSNQYTYAAEESDASQTWKDRQNPLTIKGSTKKANWNNTTPNKTVSPSVTKKEEYRIPTEAELEADADIMLKFTPLGTYTPPKRTEAQTGIYDPKEHIYRTPETTNITEDELSQVNADLVTTAEEIAIPKLKYLFGSSGFKFATSAYLGDAVEITAPNKEKKVFPLDIYFDQKKEEVSKEMKDWIRSNAVFVKSNAITEVEKEINQNNRKILTETEYDNSLKKLNLEANKSRELSVNFVKKRDNYISLNKEISNYPETEKNTIEYQDLLSQRDDIYKQLDADVKEIDIKQPLINKQIQDLNYSVGKYTDMLSNQGSVGGAIVENVVGGAGKTASGILNLALDLALANPNSRMTESEIKAAKKQINSFTDPIIRDGLNTLIFGEDATTEEFKSSEDRYFVSQAAMGVATSSIAMLSGGGMLTGLITFGLGYDDMDKQMNSNPEFDNVPESNKLLLKMISAGTTSALETYGVRNSIQSKGLLNGIILKVLKQYNPKMSSMSTRELINNVIEGDLQKGVIKVIGASLAEGETGLAQEVTDIGIKDLYNEIKNKKIFITPKNVSEYISQVGKAALLEAAGGGMMMGRTFVSHAYKSNEFKDLSDNVLKAFGLTTNNEKLQKAYVADLKLKVNLGELSLDEAKQELANYQKAEQLFNQIPPGLSLDQTKESLDLLKQKQDLTEKIKDKDPSLVKPYKDQIDAIDKKLTNISNNAIQEQTTSESVLRNQQPEMGLQEMGEGDTQLQETTTGTQKALTDEEQKRKVILEEALQSPDTTTGTVTIGNIAVPIAEAQKELDALAQTTQQVKPLNEITDESKTKNQTKTDEAQVLEPIEFSKQIENEYGVVVDLTGNSDKGDLTLSRIEVPKDERSTGVGSKAMEAIIKYADSIGRRIVLTPSIDFGGTSVNRLKEFYKKFGFVENKGKNKDFSTKESMYRQPQTIENPKVTNPLTKAAKTLLSNLKNVKIPTVITNNLQKIAKENGIEITDKTTVKDIINALKEKQSQYLAAVDSGISITNAEKINALKAKGSELHSSIINTAQKAIKTLKSVLPNFDIVIHDTEESYNAAVEQVNGEENTKGNFYYIKDNDGSLSGRIDINLNRANKLTVAHEVAHGIMLKVFGENSEIYEKFVDNIRKILNTTTDDYLVDFANKYTGDVKYEEYIVELAAILEQEYTKISPTILQKIAAVINETVSKITGGKITVFEDTKNTKELIDFLNTVSKSIRQGEEINGDYLKELNSGGEIGIFNFGSKSSKDTKKAPSVSDDSRSFIKNLVEDIDIKEFNGMPFVTNMYDYTTAGETDLGNGFKINMLGGKNYVPYMMSLKNKKLGDVSNLAAFNSQAQAESFIRNAKEGKASLFAPHSGTLSNSWQFQQHTFAELINLITDKGIMSDSELIDTFNKTIESNSENKAAFKAFKDKYGKNIKNFSSFKSNPKKIVELLDIKNNYSPDLRKALNNAIAANKIFQKAIGVKNKEEFFNRIMDPLNKGVEGGEIINVIKFDPNTFKIVETKPDAIDHHPSFGWSLLAKINGIYQPTDFYKSSNVTESYTKYNKSGSETSRKAQEPKFEQKNVASSAGAIPKVAVFEVTNAVSKSQVATKSDNFFDKMDVVFPNDHLGGGYAATDENGNLLGRIKMTQIDDNTVKIDEIVSKNKGERTGNGSKIMNIVTKVADENNVKMILTPNLIGEMKAKGIETPQKLKEFYSKFGFEKSTKNNMMERNPVVSKSQVSTEGKYEEIKDTFFGGLDANKNRLFFTDLSSVAQMRGDSRSDVAMMFDGATFWLSESNDGYVTIDDFQVNPDKLGQGRGSESLKTLTNFADKNNITLIGEPLAQSERRAGTKKGLNQKQLNEFYKKNGFTKISKDTLSKNRAAENNFFERVPVVSDKVQSEVDKINKEFPISKSQKEQNIKDLASKIRSKKLSGLGVHVDFGISKTIYNGALEIAAREVEKGSKLGNAINKAIQWIDSKINNAKWNKGLFAKHLNDKYKVTLNGKEVEVEVDNSKPTAELINGFYSPLERGINKSKLDKATGKEWLKRLIGETEGDELKWTGVADYLTENSDKVISKNDLLDYFKTNRIEIVEVVKGIPELYIKDLDAEFDGSGFTIRYNGEGRIIMPYITLSQIDLTEEDTFDEDFDYYSAQEAAKEAAINEILDRDPFGETKFSQYQLEGEKTDYKEVLVTMPRKNLTKPKDARYKELIAEQNRLEKEYNKYDDLSYSRDEKIAKEATTKREEISLEMGGISQELDTYTPIKENTKFKSTHFEQPNILVHLRMNTRTDAEGNKVLFLEEVQSDWGQQGKKEGFKQDFTAEEKEFLTLRELLYKGDLSKEQGDRYDYLFDKVGASIVKNVNKGKTPAAPFVMDTNAWAKLGLKVALKEAVKQGSDKIAWTTGEQQNDRYDLRKQVDEILYSKLDNGKYIISADKNNQSISSGVYSESQLEGVLGKEISNKIINNEGNVSKEYHSVMGNDYYSGQPREHKVLKGDYLKIGGKGMKGFYGSPKEGSLGIVGNVAKSLFKQEPKTVEIELGKQKVSDKKPNKKLIELAREKYKLEQLSQTVRNNKEYFEIEQRIKEIDEEIYKLENTKLSTQYSIEITPELKQSVESGIPLFKGLNQPVSKSQKGDLSESNLPGYDAMIKKLDKIIDETSNKIDSTKQRVYTSALAYLQSSLVYENATYVQHEALVRMLNKKLGVREKSAPSPGKLFDTIKDIKNITMTDTQLLKQRIRDMAKSSRDTKAAWLKISAEVIKSVRALKINGKISTSQLTAILNKFSKINMFNDDSINTFLDYMSNVFKDVDYQNKLIAANKIKIQIAKLAANKSKNIDLRALAKKFLELDTSLVEDIDRYNSIATQLKESITGTKSSDNFVDIIDIVPTLKYIETVKKIQDRILFNRASEQLEELFGIDDTSGMTYNQIIKLIKEDKLIIKKEDEGLFRKKAKGRFDSFSAIINKIISTGTEPISGDIFELTASEERTIKNFMSMDLSLLDLKTVIEAVDALQNFIQNKSIAKMDSVLYEYTGLKNSLELIKNKLISKKIKLYFSGIIGRSAYEQLSSLPSLIEKMFKGVIKGGIFEDKSGISDVINGKAEAINEVKRFAVEYTKEFGDKKPNGKDFFDEENIVERGMYAHMLRTIIGTEEQMKDDFIRSKNDIIDSIENLKNDKRSEEENKLGELYEKVYNRILKDAESIEDIEKIGIINRINKKAVRFWVDKWESKFDEMSDVSKSIYNEILEREYNYTPARYIQTELAKELNIDEKKSVFNTNNFRPGTLYKEESGSLKKAQHKPLPIGSYINLSFDTNNVNSMYDALIDIKTAGPIRQLEAFMKNMSKIIPNENDRKLLKSRINNYVELTRNKNVINNEELSRAINKLNSITSIGVASALTSLSQPVKQVIPLAFNTMINANGLDIRNIWNKQIRDFIDNSGTTVANRSMASEAQITKSNKLEDLINNSSGIKQLEYIKKLGEFQLKLLLEKPDVFIARASWFTYYKQYLSKNKIKFDFNVYNEDAKNYATRMVNRQQNISDPDLGGMLFTKNDAYRKIAVKTIFAFANFRINQSIRLINDVTTLTSFTSSKQDKAIAAKSLAGFAVEAAAFRLVSIGATALLDSITNSIWGGDDDEEEKQKRLNNIYKGQATNLAADMLSPIPLLDPVAIFGVNYISNMLQMDKPEKERLLLFDAKPKEFLQQLGTLGIAAEDGMKLYELSKMIATKKFVDDYGNTKTLSDEDINKLPLLLLLSSVSMLKLVPTDVKAIAKREIAIIKKQGKTEKQLTKKTSSKSDDIEDIDKEINNIDKEINDAINNAFKF